MSKVICSLCWALRCSLLPYRTCPTLCWGTLLFGSPEATLDLFIRPLPFWAVYLSVLVFPLTQGVTELPTYFGYVMPRFKAQGMQKWLAISLPALMLGLQHIAVPLLFDMRFITWRALMYIPLRLFTRHCYPLAAALAALLCHHPRADEHVPGAYVFGCGILKV
jgi:hypothetical protein